MPPTMRGNPIHSYRRPPCPRLSPAPIPVITASRLTPASCIASIARRVPSENTVHFAQEGGTKCPYADAPGDSIGARHGTLGHTGVEHRALDRRRLAAASDLMLLATATA